MNSRPVTTTELRAFIPLDSLSDEYLDRLVEQARWLRFPPATDLFHEGDQGDKTLYLKSGVVDLFQGELLKESVQGGTEQARHPLAPGTPRPLSARTGTAVELLELDTRTLDAVLTWQQEIARFESELHWQVEGGHADWLPRLLRVHDLHRVPPANIHTMLQRMQPVRYTAGQTVIRQGEAGDWFYIIASGRCRVTRETPRTPRGVTLGELGPGDSFGEEALVSGAPRNATITMLTDGTLLRLSKEDFRTLLQEPMVERVSLTKAKAMAMQGALCLDVRLPSEFEQAHVPGSANIPLFFLRRQMPKLDHNATYLVYCDNGGRSAAAVYLLNQNGYKAYVIEGGLPVEMLKKGGE
jgi:CRP-like cAMP-binding protein